MWEIPKEKKIYIYQVFTFLKKAPNFSFQKYLLGVLSLLQRKMSTLFLCGSSVLHFQTSLGEGDSYFMIIYVRIHQTPQVWHQLISFFPPMLSVWPYTHLCYDPGLTRKSFILSSLWHHHLILCVLLQERAASRILHFSKAPKSHLLRGLKKRKEKKKRKRKGKKERKEKKERKKNKKVLSLHPRFLSPAFPSENLGINCPHRLPFRPAPSSKIWLDFSSQPSAQLDFWFQPPSHLPPSPLQTPC